jgi:hypothetical protein
MSIRQDYYKGKSSIMEKGERRRSKVINSIVDLYVRREAESRKRQELIRRLNKSFSQEHVLLNRSIEEAKKRRKKETIKSYLRLKETTRSVANRSLQGPLGAPAQSSLDRKAMQFLTPIPAQLRPFN